MIHSRYIPVYPDMHTVVIEWCVYYKGLSAVKKQQFFKSCIFGLMKDFLQTRAHEHLCLVGHSNYAFPTGSVYETAPASSESASNLKILHIVNKAGLFHILFGLSYFAYSNPERVTLETGFVLLYL